MALSDVYGFVRNILLSPQHFNVCSRLLLWGELLVTLAVIWIVPCG